MANDMMNHMIHQVKGKYPSIICINFSSLFNQNNFDTSGAGASFVYTGYYFYNPIKFKNILLDPEDLPNRVVDGAYEYKFSKTIQNQNGYRVIEIEVKDNFNNKMFELKYFYQVYSLISSGFEKMKAHLLYLMNLVENIRFFMKLSLEILIQAT